MSQRIVHSCCGDRVLITYEWIWAVRGANTSHNLQWIRRPNVAWPSPPALKVFSQIDGVYETNVRGQRGGIIAVSIRAAIFRVFVASELAQNSAAIRMVLNHERSHEVLCYVNMREFVEKIAADFEEKELSSVQEIHDEFQLLEPSLPGLWMKAITSRDNADWPALHEALERVGVSTNLGQAAEGL